MKRFDQAELIPIKKAISDDLSDLKAQGGHYLDVSSTSLKVDSLEKSVASLPLLVDSTLQPMKNEAAPTATDADFWTRTWEKTLGMLKGMVEIRKLDSNDAMLLSPEQIYFVRANLRLRLLDARLALLQHNNEIYKKNLDEVKLAVMQYFDTSAPTTQEWLKTLDELSQQNLQIVSDTALSRSQTAIRNYQNQAEVEKQPISMNDIPARSDVVLPTIATNSVDSKVENKSASQVVGSVASTIQAASAPVVAASKVAAPIEKSATEKTTQPETKAENQTDSTQTKVASGVSSGTVAAATTGLAAVPLAKALSDKMADNKTDEAKKDDKKSITKDKADKPKAKSERDKNKHKNDRKKSN